MTIQVSKLSSPGLVPSTRLAQRWKGLFDRRKCTEQASLAKFLSPEIKKTEGEGKRRRKDET